MYSTLFFFCLLEFFTDIDSDVVLNFKFKEKTVKSIEIIPRFFSNAPSFTMQVLQDCLKSDLHHKSFQFFVFIWRIHYILKHCILIPLAAAGRR